MSKRSKKSLSEFLDKIKSLQIVTGTSAHGKPKQSWKVATTMPNPLCKECGDIPGVEISLRREQPPQQHNDSQEQALTE